MNDRQLLRSDDPKADGLETTQFEPFDQLCDDPESGRSVIAPSGGLTTPFGLISLADVRPTIKLSVQIGRGTSLIGLLALAAVATAECPAERAHYVLRGRPDVTAYFRAVESGKDWPSQLALAISSSKTGKTTWWVPWQGGTDARTNIASTTDVTRSGWRPPNPDDGPRPLGDRQFLTMDATYNIMEGVPQRGMAAPMHMLNPDAGSSRDEVFPVKQFFDFVGCSKEGS